MNHRASDREREAASEALRAAAGEGRLTVEELDERLGSAYAAVTRAELAELTADLPAAPGDADPVTAGDDGERWVVSVMGGADRLGRWRIARRCTVVNVMGGADLDLQQAELAAPEVELRVFSVMGGADVWVPDHLNVRVSSFALMGGNDVRLPDRPERPGGPTVHLRLISVMGGTDVRRGPRRRRSRPRPPHLRPPH